jgi:hypothetical protein
MSESDLCGEAVWTTERLGGESGQMIDVLWLTRSEQWLEQWILEDAGVEGVFEAVERLFTTCEFVE